jgi:hypothetical protein
MRKDSLPGATYSHCSQTLIPHMPVPPQEYTPSLSHKTILRLLNLPCLGLQQHTKPEFSKLCGSYMTPSRISHFLHALSHLERVSHRPGNLLLQPQPPPSPGESVAHIPDNLLLHLCSSTRRTTIRPNKEQMTTTNHTQPRDYVATTTHSYNTRDIENYGMLKFHRRQQPKQLIMNSDLQCG